MASKKVSKFEAYTMFTKTKPWGYDPEEVETEINRLVGLLQQVNDKCAELQQIALSKDATINRLQTELKDLHFQLSSLELPDADEAVENFVLSEFKSYNHDDFGEIKPPSTSNPTSNQPEGFQIVGDRPSNEGRKQDSDEDDDNDFKIVM